MDRHGFYRPRVTGLVVLLIILYKPVAYEAGKNDNFTLPDSGLCGGNKIRSFNQKYRP